VRTTDDGVGEHKPEGAERRARVRGTCERATRAECEFLERRFLSPRGWRASRLETWRRPWTWTGTRTTSRAALVPCEDSPHTAGAHPHAPARFGVRGASLAVGANFLCYLRPRVPLSSRAARRSMKGLSLFYRKARSFSSLTDVEGARKNHTLFSCRGTVPPPP
jgi:hypothetical protein